MEFLFGQDLGTITTIFLALCLFGIGYNALISWMGRRGYTEGYMSLLVAFGVMITLGAVSILSIRGGHIGTADVRCQWNANDCRVHLPTYVRTRKGGSYSKSITELSFVALSSPLAGISGSTN